MRESFLDGKVILDPRDCLYALRDLESDSIDSCVTDPPYELKFMGKGWDGTGIAFQVETWRRVLRVLKPGAHLLAFGGTRTYHRMACAIEDAGFEVRDMIAWSFGQGFPKSLNIALEYEKRLCKAIKRDDRTVWVYLSDGADILREAPFRSDDANEWAGWGTAFKPAIEPICFARKPLSESTVAANVLKWGTGALNIDGCRVGVDPVADASQIRTMSRSVRQGGDGWGMSTVAGDVPQVVRPDGRWPANVIHDGSDEVVGAFPDVDGVVGALHDPNGSLGYHGGAQGAYRKGMPDSGSAARFFYTAKADADDRLGSKHPTVKPVDLIQYLCRLVTPPGGLILDCFAGTGTTGEAAWREGFRAILIEREEEYQNDIRRRMALCLAGPQERKRASIAARTKDRLVDAGPLFSGSETPPARADRFTESSRTNDRADGTEVVKP